MANDFSVCRKGNAAAAFTACTRIIKTSSSNEKLDHAHRRRGQIHCQRGNAAAARADFNAKPRAIQSTLRRLGYFNGAPGDVMTGAAAAAVNRYIKDGCKRT